MLVSLVAFILGMSDILDPSGSAGRVRPTGAPEPSEAVSARGQSDTTLSPAAAQPALAVDPWLVAPDTAPKRVADTRRQPMRLSALFEEFSHYLRVEKEAAPPPTAATAGAAQVETRATRLKNGQRRFDAVARPM